MADFDPNPRGGLNTNRESLHASAEYRRQVSALEQMKESEMAEKMTLEKVRDVLRAAGRYDLYGTDLQACDLADAITANLAQPAQAEGWRDCSGDPASCPENEGYGCCKANPTPPQPEE